jgi:hypothetical protein
VWLGGAYETRFKMNQQRLRSISLVTLWLSCITTLAAFYIWFREQRDYRSIIEQFSLTLHPVSRFFISTSPFFVLPFSLAIAAFLIWKERAWKVSALMLILNVTFLVISALMLWIADASMRGSLMTLIEQLSK